MRGTRIFGGFVPPPQTQTERKVMEPIGSAKVHDAFNVARSKILYLEDHVRITSKESAVLSQMAKDLDAMHHDYSERLSAE